jgi:hypothetical protein
MSLDKKTKQKILRDLVVSLFICAAGHPDVPFILSDRKKAVAGSQTKSSTAIIHR